MEKAGFLIYNLILALWVGGIAVFTFVVTPVIFKSFSRDTASDMVGRLFPVFFAFVLALSVLALAVFLGTFGLGPGVWKRVSLALLCAAVVINVFVTFKLYPEMKSVKAQVYSFEDTAADSPERRRFGALHGISSALNLLVLLDGVALLFISSALKK
ncbi:MAG: DUF4149 domain-containing protein [Nitrospirota bacterium]|jgi:hypothetical protein